jgi:hypothetical protein
MRAIGPDIRIEVERRPLDRLSDERRADNETRLREHLRPLTQAKSSVRADFDATRKELRAKKLPAEILARHDQAVRDFEQRAAEFHRAAKAWTDGTDDAKLQALTDLDDFFKRYPATRTAAPLDPKKLPWRATEPTTRQPADTQTAWFENLWGHPRLMLAQAGGQRRTDQLQRTARTRPGAHRGRSRPDPRDPAQPSLLPSGRRPGPAATAA